MLDVDFEKKTKISISIRKPIFFMLKKLTLKLASDPFRLCRNSIAGLPGSVSELSILSQGLHSLFDIIFIPAIVLLRIKKSMEIGVMHLLE